MKLSIKQFKCVDAYDQTYSDYYKIYSDDTLVFILYVDNDDFRLSRLWGLESPDAYKELGINITKYAMPVDYEMLENYVIPNDTDELIELT